MNDTKASCLFGLKWKTRILHGWCVGIEKKTNGGSVKEKYIRTYFKWHDKTWYLTLHWKVVNAGPGLMASILHRPVYIPPIVPPLQEPPMSPPPVTAAIVANHQQGGSSMGINVQQPQALTLMPPMTMLINNVINNVDWVTQEERYA